MTLPVISGNLNVKASGNMTSFSTVQLNSGYAIPQIGLGTWKSEAGKVQAAVENAISAGYRHIDCAHIYRNENEVGKAIQHKIEEGIVKRDELFVTSKLWNEHHDPEVVTEALQLSLQELQLDYLDLYLMHWPMSWKKVETGGIYLNYVDDDFDYVGTYKAMEKSVDAGLVRSLGVSNFNSQQLQVLMDQSSIKPTVLQIEVHPYLNNRRLVEFCQKQGIVVTASSPFASPDKARSTYKETDPSPLADPTIQDIAQQYRKTPAQVILRWLIQRGIIVIPKSVTPSRIQANLDVFDFALSEKDMAALYGLNRDFRCCDIFPESRYYPFKEDF